jgi:hypothetical protein
LIGNGKIKRRSGRENFINRSKVTRQKRQLLCPVQPSVSVARFLMFSTIAGADINHASDSATIILDFL